MVMSNSKGGSGFGQMAPQFSGFTAPSQQGWSIGAPMGSMAGASQPPRFSPLPEYGNPTPQPDPTPVMPQPADPIIGDFGPGGWRGVAPMPGSPQPNPTPVMPQPGPIGDFGPGGVPGWRNGNIAPMPNTPAPNPMPVMPQPTPQFSPLPEYSNPGPIGDFGPGGVPGWRNGNIAPTPGPQVSRPTEQVAFNSPEWHRQNRNYHNEGSHTNWRATPLDQRKSAVQAAPAPSPLPAPGPSRYQQMAQAINQRALARGGR